MGALGLLNLVTGVFVEGAARTCKEDRTFELTKRVQEVFKRSDCDENGLITPVEFKTLLCTPEMEELLHLIDIRPSVAHDLFNILDVDGSGSLTDAEFVAGAINLQFPAK